MYQCVQGGGGSIFYNPKDYSLDYFTTVAKTSGSISFNGSTSNKLSYSTDNGATWSNASRTPSVTVRPRDMVLWKGECTPYLSYGIGTFTNGTTTFDVKGNVMSLLFGDDFKGKTSLVGKDYVFRSLFSGNTKVISAMNLSLPATTLAKYCYSSMFNGCSSLESAPELPATTLARSCYSSMFDGCTSLATAPELPATELAEACYSNMFYGTNVLPDCSNIDFTSQSVVDVGGLQSLFAGTNVTDNDLEQILPKDNNGKYCLPVTTLADYCYSSMFNGCINLESAPALPATALADSCYAGMFEGCISLVSAPELPAMALADSCYTSMFYGCNSLETAPELPAETLVQSCYEEMFYNCRSLNSITCLATDISADSCTTNWVNGVASEGTFTKDASMEDWTEDDPSGIPMDWTAVDKQ